jgi:dTDP-4-amino-4,6-dideoxygalactose transaminase
MDGVMAMAAEHKLTVIEDCAQAHGAEYKGRRVGSIGHSACFSFFATKNMTTGEGGMILTDDDEIAQRCRLIRSHGMTDRDTHVILGYNYRMTEMEAAMGIVQLGRLDELNATRTRNSEYLLTHLDGIPWLKLPKIESCVKHAYFWCPLQVDEGKLGMSTKELVALLREHGVEVRHRYNEPLYRQPLLANRENYPLNCGHYQGAPDYGALFLPNVEQVAGKMIGLPNHPNLTQAQLDRVLEVLLGIVD